MHSAAELAEARVVAHAIRDEHLQFVMGNQVELGLDRTALSPQTIARGVLVSTAPGQIALAQGSRARYIDRSRINSITARTDEGKVFFSSVRSDWAEQAKDQVVSVPVEDDKCLLCGWDLRHPYKGRIVPEADIVRGQATGASWAAHGVCLIREGISLGGRIAELVGYVDADEAYTPKGTQVLAAGRIS